MSVNEIILEKLNEKKWFVATDKKIKEDLVSVADTGLLKRLGELADVNEFGELQKIINLTNGENIVGLTFEVRSSVNNEVVKSEVVAWKNGDNFLSRGIIILEKDGLPTHILVEKKFNLVNFKTELQTFTMAYPDFVDGKIVKLPQKLSKAIPNHTVRMYYDLGYVYPENGLILGKTFIFALSVNVEDIGKIDTSKVQLLDINKSDEWNEIHDSYFLSIYAQLILKKIL
ncbi:MAG: hypothetical protein WC851_03055 [Candidatus Shapirobacteria bacterium]|jgi:hypothetical protein